MKKISEIMLKIFAIGILACLFAGGLSLIAYVVALFIGGEQATNICTVTYKVYLPWVIKISSVFTGIGLIGMYFDKQKALTIKSENIIEEK